jgi:acylphosphatase
VTGLFPEGQGGGAAMAIHVLVEGRVQGVGFRYTCLGEGRRLGLTGWVRNTPDGDVEVWAEGREPKLEAFLAWLRRGPPLARVDRVDYQKREPLGVYRDFGVEG